MKLICRKSRHRLLAGFSCCASLLLMVAVSPAQVGKVSASERSQLEAAVSKFMAGSSAPGLSAAVVQDGELVWSAGFGLADLENFVPATADTLYRLASVSKPLTAVGAMRLWQMGKLDLDAPVQKYCPAFPQKEAPITTREALGHLAGIRHYRGDDDPDIYNVRHFADPIADGLKFFKDDALLSKPGAQFHYSTHGYTLVGCVMEGASGEKYVDFMRRNVLPLAGMTATQVDDQYAIIQHRSRFYQKDKSAKIVNADFLDSSYKIPGGGWLSSADDMARFEVTLLNDSLLRRATRDVMWTPLKPADGSENTYALGWGWSNAGGVAEVGHSGGQQGTSTGIVMAPDRNAGAVVLINLEEVDAIMLAKTLLNIAMNVPEGKHDK